MLTACDIFGSGEGLVVTNQARLERAAPSRSLPDVRTGGTGRDAGNFRTTPTNLSGDLCYAFLSLGELGPGMFAMTWLAPEDSFPNGPESGVRSNVTFDLAAPATITGQVYIPASEDDMPDSKQVIRAELNFNHVDATFILNGQTYTVRTVYATSFTADDADGIMVQGDKLIRLPGETRFMWAGSDGLHAARAAAGSGVYQDATVTGYDQPSEGNRDYIPVTAHFIEPFPVTWELLDDAAKTWTLEFILKDAIVWAADPSTLDTPESIVNAFRLKFGPNRSTTMGETDDGIRAVFSIE